MHEFAIHPKAGEVVAGTHGRSLWIADIRALRQFSKESMTDDAYLFQPGNLIRWSRESEQGSSGTRKFVGESGSSQVTLHYSLGKNARSVEMEVLNLSGTVIREFSELSAGSGLHAVPWNGAQQSGGGGRRGGFRRGIPTGNYLVRLKVDGQTFTRTLSVESDPNAPADAVSLEELEWYDEFLGENRENN